MLLYLYWEPTNPEDSAYVMHRRETAEFSERVNDSRVVFRSLSYLTLWRAWEATFSTAELEMHLTRLYERYAISV